MNHPIVFIHGSGDSARIWRFQIGHFGATRALAIDLPGHGQRIDTLSAEASILDYTTAVHTIITNELDLDQPIISGQSLGGAIALTMGLEYGVDLGGLILIGTGARLRVHPNLLEAAVTPRRYRVLDVTMLTTRFLKTEAHNMHIFVIVYPKNNQGAIICQAIQNGHKYAGPKELTTPEEANFLRG